MKFSIYSSKNKGVKYIDEYIPIIESQLPILLEAWECLDPLTIGGNIRKDLDRNLSLIFTGHYTIVKSLNYVQKNKDSVGMNDPEQRFKNIYFHFGLIIDCIRQISRSIVLFKNALGILSYQEESLNIEEVRARTERWYNSRYNSELIKLNNFGISINIPIQPRAEYISYLAPTGEIKKFNSFKTCILPYRNILVHNPTIDIFRRSDLNGDHVVKKDKVKNYRFLNEIDSIDKKDLISPSLMTNQDYLDCIEVISEIWTVFIRNMRELTTHPTFPIKSKKKSI